MRRIHLLFSLLVLVSMLFALAPAGLAQPPEPLEGLEGAGPWVVRAYYDDPDMILQVVSWTEPWEVQREEGYLVLEVDGEQIEWLVEAGYRLEVDEALTAQLHQVNEYLPGQIDGIPGYECYRTVEETYATAVSITLDYPDLATWTDVGDSWEKTEPGGLPGYDLMVLKLTNANVPGPKPKLFIMSAVHAREYTTAELSTRYAEYLVENYGVDADVTWILDYHEIHLLLQANPDGRKRAEGGILWRKNTNNNYCSGTNSRGADLNRNFEFQWGCCGGSSGSPCNDLYRGPSAASEPETQTVQNYVRSQYPDLREDPFSSPAPPTTTGIFMDTHSYSELVLWAWGFTSSVAPNGVAMQTLGRKFAFYNGYWPEQAYHLYPTDGTTDDFAYGDLGLPAYTFELGTWFFQDCSTFENTILPDNMLSYIYAAKVVGLPYLTPAGPDALDPTVVPEVVAPGDPVQLTATINDTRYNNSNGSEPTQNIAAAEYYIDVPPWVTTTTPVAYPMTPVDGSFNATIEDVEATIDTSALSNGRHILFVRGQDANGNWGAFSAVFVTVEGQPCLPVEILDVLTETVGCTVTFAAELTGTAPFNYLWDMGALGSYSTPATMVDFGTSGDYAYTLTVTNCGGAGQAMYSATVTVFCCQEVYGADFDWAPPVPAVDEVVTFDGVASGTTPIDLDWNFGDGDTAAGATVTHSYALGGDYTVTMTATNACGQQIVSHDIGVCTPVYGAGFVWTPTNPLVGEALTLSAVASGTGSISFTWDLGDDSRAAGISVTHSYTQAGDYEVTLTATNDCGKEIVTATVSVVPLCEAVHNIDFAYTPSQPIFNQNIALTASVSGTAPFSYSWDLGDGHTASGITTTHAYTLPGSYTVWLTVSNCAGTAVEGIFHSLEVGAYWLYLPLVYK